MKIIGKNSHICQVCTSLLMPQFSLLLQRHQQELIKLHEEKMKYVEESGTHVTQCEALQAALDQMESTLLAKVCGQKYVANQV